MEIGNLEVLFRGCRGFGNAELYCRGISSSSIRLCEDGFGLFWGELFKAIWTDVFVYLNAGFC